MPSTLNTTVPAHRPLFFRLLVRSWDYRRPQFWIPLRFALAIWNLVLSTALMGVGLYGYGLIPLGGGVLLLCTVKHLQNSAHRPLQS